MVLFTKTKTICTLNLKNRSLFTNVLAVLCKHWDLIIKRCHHLCLHCCSSKATDTKWQQFQEYSNFKRKQLSIQSKDRKAHTRSSRVFRSPAGKSKESPRTEFAQRRREREKDKEGKHVRCRHLWRPRRAWKKARAFQAPSGDEQRLRARFAVGT